MTRHKLTDFLAHVLLPLFLGGLFYVSVWIDHTSFPGSNFLPDGLWAYAFCSAILIVWDRAINKIWLLVAALIAISFEILQHLGWINGTGDVLDVVVYYWFAGIAILINRSLSSTYKHYKQQTTTPSSSSS